MSHGCKAAHRMCPPPRSLALEANGCFMVWVQPDPTEYKVAARGFARHGGLPSVRSCSARLFSAAAASGLQPENLKRRFPAGPGLARGSQPPTPLRAAFAGGLRPVLTAAARRTRWCLAAAKKRPLSTEQRNTLKGARWRRNQLDIQSPIQGSSVTSCRLILLILDFTTSASRRTNRCPKESGAAQAMSLPQVRHRNFVQYPQVRPEPFPAKAG